MAIWPSYEYAMKRAEKVGTKKFLKNTLYFIAPYTAYCINLATAHSTQSLPHADISFFSNDLLSNLGTVLSHAGNIFTIFSLTHLYGLQAGHFLGEIKEGIKKTGFGLVTHLEYGLTRNPVYLGLRTASLGYFLEKPSLGNAAAFALIFLTTEMAARGEEKYLEMMWGERYKEYKGRVPRWIPRPKRIFEMIKTPRMVKGKFDEDATAALLFRKKYSMPKQQFEKLLEKLREEDPFIPTVLDE